MKGKHESRSFAPKKTKKKRKGFKLKSKVKYLFINSIQKVNNQEPGTPKTPLLHFAQWAGPS